MQQQLFQEAYDAEIRQRLMAQTFPQQELPEHFHAWAGLALRHESKASLGVDLDTFKRLHGYCDYSVPAPMTLFDMGYLLNSIEKRTPEEWNGTDYHEVMAAQDKLAARWNEIVTPIKEAIIRKLQTQAQISKGVPAHKRVIGKA